MHKAREIAKAIAKTNKIAAERYLDKAWLRRQIEDAAEEAGREWEKKYRMLDK